MAGALSPAGEDPAPAPAPPARSGVLRRRIAFGLMLLGALGGLLALDAFGGTRVGISVIVLVALGMGATEAVRMLAPEASALLRAVPIACAALLVGLQWAHLEAAVREVAAAAHGLQGVCFADAARAVPVHDVELLAVGFLLMATLTVGLGREPSRERLQTLVMTAFAGVYVVGLGSLALKLRGVRWPVADERALADLARAFEGLWIADLGLAALLYAVLGAKGTDIFAFFTGRALGKRKLIPWISPGKTWAGAVGALAGGVAITMLFFWATPLGLLFPWWVSWPLGILVATVTMVGDLVESLIKRSALVKDSGALIPEFGGVLDVIDSILFTLPVVYVAVLLGLWRIA